MTSMMPQDDVMFGLLRVMEQISFQAALRLPRDMTHEERERRIRATMDRLSISSCKDNLIGGPGYRRSVSGGERKRTSVASELVTNPAVVFLDEPISGLDAHNAYAVVSLLRELTREGRLVICSIHQPSVEVFELFDKARPHSCFSGLFLQQTLLTPICNASGVIACKGESSCGGIVPHHCC